MIVQMKSESGDVVFEESFDDIRKALEKAHQLKQILPEPWIAMVLVESTPVAIFKGTGEEFYY